MRKIFVLAIIIMFSFCACGEGRNNYDEELSEEVVIKENNYLQDLGEYINGFTNESESSIDLEEREITETGSEIIENNVWSETVPVEEETGDYAMIPTAMQSSFKNSVKDGYWYFVANIDGNYKLFVYDLSERKVVNKNGMDWKHTRNHLSGKTYIMLRLSQPDFQLI